MSDAVRHAVRIVDNAPCLSGLYHNGLAFWCDGEHNLDSVVHGDNSRGLFWTESAPGALRKEQDAKV